MIAIVFTPEISVGNLISSALILSGMIGAYWNLKYQSKNNGDLLKRLEDRINHAELEKLQMQVETMWAFQLRRGLNEVEKKGLGKMNSPMRLTEQACKLMEPMLPDLKKFYEEINGNRLGTVDLAVAIEHKFGDRISQEICNKAHISDGACLV